MARKMLGLAVVRNEIIEKFCREKIKMQTMYVLKNLNRILKYS